MRVAKVLLPLSLLLGAAPALAQESPGIIPTPPQPEVAPAAKPVQPKAAAPALKSANSKEALPTLAPKSADDTAVRDPPRRRKTRRNQAGRDQADRRKNRDACAPPAKSRACARHV